MLIHHAHVRSNTYCTGSSAVDGGWSEWKIVCSKTCGGGYKKYTRTCDSPTPSHGGKDCDGPSYQNLTEICNTNCCPGQINALLLKLLLNYS